ncbi:MAG: hypothetical protein KAJ49_05900 [Arcobacteraceae bacterium]|nr:hypothetical protein [Arcobacteraceae bacterium]
MFYRPLEDIILIAVFMSVLITGIMFIVMQTDNIQINIEYNYLDDLRQCEQDLENTQPICPACECKAGGGWIFAMIVGFIWGIVISLLWIDYKNKQKQTQKKK